MNRVGVQFSFEVFGEGLASAPREVSEASQDKDDGSMVSAVVGLVASDGVLLGEDVLVLHEIFLIFI